jgi:hypothetical protein
VSKLPWHSRITGLRVSNLGAVSLKQSVPRHELGSEVRCVCFEVSGARNQKYSEPKESTTPQMRSNNLEGQLQCLLHIMLHDFVQK